MMKAGKNLNLDKYLIQIRRVDISTYIFIHICSIQLQNCTDLDGELVRSLNGIQNLIRKLNDQNSIGSKFDPQFLIEFTNCLKKLDPTLWKSVNAQWRGFQIFSRSDTWKQCDANDNTTNKVNMKMLKSLTKDNFIEIALNDNNQISA